MSELSSIENINKQVNRIAKTEELGEEFIKQNPNNIFASNLVMSRVNNEIDAFLDMCDDLLEECSDAKKAGK